MTCLDAGSFHSRNLFFNVCVCGPWPGSSKPMNFPTSLDTLDWLLEGPSWVAYRTRLDLLEQSESDAEVRAARTAMLAEPRMKALIGEVAAWPGAVLTSHKSAGHLIHKLTFLAGLGLQATDPGMDELVDRVMAHRSAQGPFQVLANIPIQYGGTGLDSFAWALCDAPLLLYSLVRFGLAGDARVQEAVSYLTSLVRDNGWPCAGSPEQGNWRGPGRKADPCPYANLMMVQLLAILPQWHASPALHAGAETQLDLWMRRREEHPYQFHMGTDFCKLKAPLVWYDLLHVLDVLSQLPWLVGDERLEDMLSVLSGRADAQGRFTPQSVWTAWSNWEFGQKKEPSRWLTMLALRALKRCQTHSTTA
jgi:hypothetical protein